MGNERGVKADKQDAALLAAADRFAAGGCCGKRPQVTMDDMRVLGLLPMPATFESSFGTIVPLSGWKALCVYAYERLAGVPFKNQPGKARPRWKVVLVRVYERLLRRPFPIAAWRRDEDPPDAGEAVATAILGIYAVGRAHRLLSQQISHEAGKAGE